jgi:hypothetical protein
VMTCKELGLIPKVCLLVVIAASLVWTQSTVTNLPCSTVTNGVATTIATSVYAGLTYTPGSPTTVLQFSGCSWTNPTLLFNYTSPNSVAIRLDRVQVSGGQILGATTLLGHPLRSLGVSAKTTAQRLEVVDSTLTGLSDAVCFDGALVGFALSIQRTTIDGTTWCAASYRSVVVGGGLGFVNDSAIDIRDSSLAVSGTGSAGRALAGSVVVLSSSRNFTVSVHNSTLAVTSSNAMVLCGSFFTGGGTDASSHADISLSSSDRNLACTSTASMPAATLSIALDANAALVAMSVSALRLDSANSTLLADSTSTTACVGIANGAHQNLNISIDNAVFRIVGGSAKVTGRGAAVVGVASWFSNDYMWLSASRTNFSAIGVTSIECMGANPTTVCAVAGISAITEWPE